MREIKFRAWDKNKNMMVYPSEKYTNGGLLDWFEDDDLMQFTGLLDRNGKEIYEGDIVQREQGEGEKDNVTFDDGSFLVDGESMCEFVWRNYLVVGNIYENQELKNG
jgi:uncharacterized phage protein (TIGR01671 family)